MSAFTCITCRVAFADADLQRAHYKADWHRYNLKRKVADMPPVTAENFKARVLSQKAQLAEQEAPKDSHCDVCNKHFSTENAYSNHLQSKKHKEVASKKAQQEKKVQDTSSGQKPDISDSERTVLEKNARNQAIKDGLLAASGSSQGQSSASTGASTSMPGQSSVQQQEEEDDDEDMDSDAESWSGDALGLEECLFCSHISKTLEINVEHMTKTHSFFLPDIEYLTDLEGLITYLGAKVGEGHICLWCNEKGRGFASTRAVQQHMVDKGHCKLLHEGDVLLEYVDFYDYRSSYPDHAEHQGAEGGEEAMETDDQEEEVQLEVLTEDNYQLMLPSGSSIGHRSLQRYYRQSLRPDRTTGRNPSAVSRVMAQYKALGWTGTTGAAATKRAKDMAYMKRAHWRQYTKLGVKANKLQKHFREQVIY